MKIAFIPIDNRPVCYNLAEMIAKIDKNINFSIPPRYLLGDLTKPADISALLKWLSDLSEQDAIVVSLDTLTYGGLIPSRRSEESFEEIKSRVLKLIDILKVKNAKIYAFSSIMRISNNNYNEEEKEYWNLWGKKIFEYSYNSHKSGVSVISEVPKEIINDYLQTRKRNFEINKLYLELQKEGLFNTLIFSKDDCAQYGLNVMEAQELEKLGGFTKTGADEIPLTLLARAIEKKIKICPIFLEPESKNLISNYEDISIENSVKGQINLAGCEISSEEEADILLYVNNFKNRQGEIVMKVDTEKFNGVFITPNRPYMIADVRFANGADNGFVNALFKNKFEDKYFYGYSAWNTSANTLGSLICAAKFKFCAQKYDLDAFKKLQTVRFLDDWGYQANVRQILKKPDVTILNCEMKRYEKKLAEILGVDINVKYIYPWGRLFEVEIGFN